jgi:hypothetical protein
MLGIHIDIRYTNVKANSKTRVHGEAYYMDFTEWPAWHAARSHPNKPHHCATSGGTTDRLRARVVREGMTPPALLTVNFNLRQPWITLAEALRYRTTSRFTVHKWPTLKCLAYSRRITFSIRDWFYERTWQSCEPKTASMNPKSLPWYPWNLLKPSHTGLLGSAPHRYQLSHGQKMLKCWNVGRFTSWNILTHLLLNYYNGWQCLYLVTVCRRWTGAIQLI